MADKRLTPEREKEISEYLSSPGGHKPLMNVTAALKEMAFEIHELRVEKAALLTVMKADDLVKDGLHRIVCAAELFAKDQTAGNVLKLREALSQVLGPDWETT